MCKDCEALRALLLRAFGHMASSSDPQVRRTGEQVRETLRREAEKVKGR
jgi:hypothetical protein